MIRGVAVVLWLALLGSAGSVLAHAVQIASEPPDGAVLVQAPLAVVVRFNEPVTATVVEHIDATGARGSLRSVAIDNGTAFRTSLPPGLGQGRQVLSYRVMSADAHPVAGAIAFTVGAGVTAPANAGAPFPSDDPTARSLLRIVHNLAWMLTMGGALFILLVAPFPYSARMLTAASATLAVTALLGAGLTGVALQGEGAGFLDGESWRAGMHSPRGSGAMVAIVGALLIGVGGTRREGRGRNGLLALGIVALTGSALLSGHVATASPRAWASAALAIHILGAAFWTGALAALVITLTTAPTSAFIVALQRFSRLAIVAVPALVLAGVVFAAIELDTPRDLVATSYGRWIMVKVTLVLGMLLLAAANRRRWLPRAAAGDIASLAMLRRSVRVELALALCVITVAALLAQTPPARHALGASNPWQATLQHGDSRLLLTLDPGRPGFNTMTLRFASATGAVVEPAEVRIELEQPALGVGPLIRPTTKTVAGTYEWRGEDFALPGRWRIAIHARFGDFDLVTMRTEISLP